MRTALANATVDQAKGNLENDHQSITLDTNDQLFNAGAYRNIIVAYRNGAPVKLQDVGDGRSTPPSRRAPAPGSTASAASCC